MPYNPDQPRDERGRWDGGGGGMRTVAELRGGSGPRMALGPRTRATGPKLTPLDTPDVLEARYNNALQAQVNLAKEPGGLARREEIEKKLYGTGAQNKDREAYIVYGGPGSGKSTIADKLEQKIGALQVDSDFAKAELPGFNGGSGANAVHEESSIIAHNVLERAIVAGDNIVMPAVGKSRESAETNIGQLYRAGYRVHVILVDVPPRVGAERALKRWRRPDASGRNTYAGRFVDPNYVLNQVGTKPRSTYAALKRHQGVYSYARYDNSGRSARLVESGRTGHGR